MGGGGQLKKPTLYIIICYHVLLFLILLSRMLMSLVRQNEVSREPPHLGDGTLANLVPAVKDFIESTQVLPSSTEAHRQLFLDICRLTRFLGSGESQPTAQILSRRKVDHLK